VQTEDGPRSYKGDWAEQYQTPRQMNDATATLLKRIDAIAAELEGLRRDVLHLAEDAAPPTDPDTPADLLDQHLVDTATASERFSVPGDLARRWCREGCGVKRGGRWLASLPSFKRKLARG
jgi:hypothetical protein